MTNLSLEQFENGVKIYQDETLYKFTSDSIKLAKFCNIKHTDNVLDMCAGSGVVGFYVYSISNFNKLYFNDIQPEMCELIKKNINLNKLENKCKIICENLNNLNTNYFDKPLDVIMCNPPYFKINGKIKQNEKIAMCRHEITTNLQQIIFKSYQLLKNKGRVYIIIPADRMCEAINCFCQNGFEVKRIDIYNSNGNATICLFEAVKDAKSGVKIKVLKEGL